VDRRDFLRRLTVAAGATALGGSLWRDASAAAVPGTSPYGSLRTPDASGLRLPGGFTSRVVARTGHVVPGTSYTWHRAPDGGAVFPDGAGWIYVSNSEVSTTGGAGALRFSATGVVTGAHRIVDGTSLNCSGGATPWGTWLSCEEITHGTVFECDPRGVRAAVARPLMGRFRHEAAAADPVRQVVYLTEDEKDGCFYRYRPNTWGALGTGRLEVMRATSAGAVTWAAVPRPSGTPTLVRYQVGGVRRFNGGEGCFYAAGSCWFTTKGDNRVWRYDADRARLSLVYDDTMAGAPLTGNDALTVSRSQDLFVAEDGGNMEVNVITPHGVVAPFLRVEGHAASEVTGLAFTPDGSRLYLSSQRGASGLTTGGVTYEVRGPFRASAFWDRSRPYSLP
jgi:secreted PhoX family phosphatase